MLILHSHLLLIWNAFIIEKTYNLVMLKESSTWLTGKNKESLENLSFN